MPGDLIFDFFFDKLIFRIFFISFWLIIPGLRIFVFSVKSITVDSMPIFELPPSTIIFNFFLKFSNTSIEFTGLNFEERFALGIANGKFKNLSIFFIIL